MKNLIILLISVLVSSCAYNWGYGKRSLSEGYKQLAVPVFKNKTQEVGVEVFFTNAIVQQFARSKVAQVVPQKTAPIILEGEIEEIRFESESQARRSSDFLTQLPENTVLTTKYRIYMIANLKLRRLSDNKALWAGQFSSERDYSAPQIESDVINSANALYNSSARRQNLKVMADQMMIEAHDRMTENF